MITRGFEPSKEVSEMLFLLLPYLALKITQLNIYLLLFLMSRLTLLNYLYSSCCGKSIMGQLNIGNQMLTNPFSIALIQNQLQKKYNIKAFSLYRIMAKSTLGAGEGTSQLQVCKFFTTSLFCKTNIGFSIRLVHFDCEEIQNEAFR